MRFITVFLYVVYLIFYIYCNVILFTLASFYINHLIAGLSDFVIYAWPWNVAMKF